METVMAVTMLMAVMNASANGQERADFQVHVYVSFEASVSWPLILRAQDCASKLLAPTGVRLIWHYTPRGRSASPNSLAMSFLRSAPLNTGLHAEALAVALPYASTGQQILVFDDRVSDFISRYGLSSSLVLGHVLAHEIGHVLEGEVRHSDTGLMQAHWTPDNVSTMIQRGMPFAPEDISLIRVRMESVTRRASGVVAAIAK